MSARVSLCLTKCTDEGAFADWHEAVRALRQHGTHGFGCIQFVAAEAYIGSRDVA